MKPRNENHDNMMTILEVIGSKWNLMILRNLENGSLRFTELQKRMGEINSKTLTCHLRYLEKYNIVDRKVYPEVPLRVEYSLTEYGRAFLPAFKAIKAWGKSLPPPRELS